MSVAQSSMPLVSHDRLLLLNDPTVSLVVLHRALPEIAVDFVHEVLANSDWKRVAGYGEESVAGLLPDFAIASDHPGLDAFVSDLKAQVAAVKAVINDTRLQLKLESSDRGFCERFHVDRVKLRLICTYAGPGTEWLEHRDVDRSKLGPGSGGVPDEVSGLMRENAQIQRVPTLSIALMKGDLWPSHPGCGVVHRSPPTTGGRRVIFRVDCAS